MSGDTDRVPRSDIWREVAFNMIVRVVWAASLVVSGAFVRDIWAEPGVVALLGLGAACVLGLAVMFEYRRAEWRMRRQQLQARVDAERRARTTIGQFHDSLPVNEWVFDAELGYRFKRLPDYEPAEPKEAV
jgi:hypothetical protein